MQEPVDIAMDDAHSLAEQLPILHKQSEDHYADVLFLMPESPSASASVGAGVEQLSLSPSRRTSQQTIPLPKQIWAHSSLLEITCTKPLSRIGSRTFASTDRAACEQYGLPELTCRGLPYTAVEVAPEDDLFVRKLVASCYRPVVLRNLWEQSNGKRQMLAALDDDVRFEGQHAVKPVKPTVEELRSSGSSDDDNSVPAGDVTLRIEGEKLSFTIHKFLLDLRVPYFQTLFRSAFAEADQQTHTLSSEIFTPLSLVVVAQYIYLDSADLLFSWKWTDFARYMTSPKCTNEINAPRPEVMDLFVEALVAAKFLQLESLEWWIVSCLAKIAHSFSCSGVQCSRILPVIAMIGYQYDIAQLYLPAVSWLSRHSNISSLWKRNLLGVAPEVKDDLIDEVCLKINVASVIPLYLRIYSLQQIIETSVFRDDWKTTLVGPIINSCVEFVSLHFAEPRIVFSTSRCLHKLPTVISYVAIDHLFCQIGQHISKDNVAIIWRGLECHAKLISLNPALDSLNHAVVAWLSKHWRQLAPNKRQMLVYERWQEDSGHQEIQGFSTWADEDLQKLSLQINVSLNELKGITNEPKLVKMDTSIWVDQCK
ncbi:uncharacterized protein V1516DRAFT_669623 [Lipomyces oligophaga]|uniref:uncharacterized protein n=1 Tax=Lipomyces oligophaga TaxID=45792 RepID=UPI0034CF8460